MSQEISKWLLLHQNKILFRIAQPSNSVCGFKLAAENRAVRFPLGDSIKFHSNRSTLGRGDTRSGDQVPDSLSLLMEEQIDWERSQVFN